MAWISSSALKHFVGLIYCLTTYFMCLYGNAWRNKLKIVEGFLLVNDAPEGSSTNVTCHEPSAHASREQAQPRTENKHVCLPRSFQTLGVGPASGRFSPSRNVIQHILWLSREGGRGGLFEEQCRTRRIFFSQMQGVPLSQRFSDLSALAACIEIKSSWEQSNIQAKVVAASLSSPDITWDVFRVPFSDR